ncbi:flagellar basal-body MS-ring/collar protein FliF [Clostridium sp. Cult2]|uniref:flagellar basal-body MS-ring/collar protein FliF n=1 Tax=Clostridium sp. Cult2 TaxID=2079003 RepID=UPI003013FD4A|nr:flagellar M-ring protein FliF [Clostridium sp. Cult2]
MGETIHQMRNQLNEYWQNLDKNKRIKLIIIGIIAILSIIILSIVFTRTKYEVLYQDLSLKDTAQITKKLDEMGVKWKTPGDDTTTILVPSEMKNKIKIELAAYGLPKEGYGFMDAFNDTNWTMTDYDKKERWKLALQSELSSTISDIDGIESATVYINEKEDSGFVLEENKKETTASVFIEKSDNRPLKGETVTAIQNLVAGSINMNPEKVQIVDSEGRLLTGEQDESEILMTDQFNIKNNLELRINDSIRNFLENIFGAENVDVRSSVKINFDSERTTIVEFNPPIEGNEEGLIRSMEEIEEHMVGGGTGGVPGVEENPPDYTMEDDESERYDKRSSTINYELDEINKEIRKAPGQVEDITVAVLINKDVLIDGDFSQEKEREISDLIYAATGLDTRQVAVKAESFRTHELADSVEDVKTFNWLTIILALIAASSVAGYIVYRRRKSRELEELEELESQIEDVKSIRDEVEDLDFETEKSKIKTQIEKFVDRNPDAVAQLLRTWLNE